MDQEKIEVQRSAREAEAKRLEREKVKRLAKEEIQRSAREAEAKRLEREEEKRLAREAECTCLNGYICDKCKKQANDKFFKEAGFTRY